MKKHERIVKVKGKDTGVRENTRGSLYIDRKVFFSDPKVKATIKKLAESDFLKKVRTI